MTKRILHGEVVSSKGNKTIVVKVKRRFRHPFYGKVISRSKKYHAHDENNKFKEGDIAIQLPCKDKPHFFHKL